MACKTVTKKRSIAPRRNCSKAPAPHDRQAAGILCKVPGMDAHALAAEIRTRQTRRTLVSVRILRRTRLDAAVFAGERGNKP